MKKSIRSLGTAAFAAGGKIKISKDGRAVLPVSFKGERDVLFVQSSDGYRLIPLVPDVKKVYVEVTTRCNFSCVTCIRSSWRDDLADMEWETFERLLDSLKELPDLEAVHFGGFGEPMGHPRIFDMLKAVKKLGLKAEIITNGSLLTEDNIRELIGLGLDVLFTSFDSPDREEYNEIRQGGCFDSVYGSVASLQRMKKTKWTAGETALPAPSACGREGSSPVLDCKV
ncbi:MAG: radical SAM protein [Pelotomaculum sp.]|nr:radical SAM protein [Pelotomaculum sp.]